MEVSSRFSEAKRQFTVYRGNPVTFSPPIFDRKSRRKYICIKDLSILQYDVIFLSPDFLRKLRGFSKSFAYVGSVAKGNIG